MTVSSRWISPLRYPGGKARMTQWLLGVLDNNRCTRMDAEIWVEPFAGGAGAGLTALENGTVSETWLVEAHPAVAAFWQSVVEDNEAMARRIEAVVPTLALFEEAREMVAAGLTGEGVNRLDLGVAAFIVNRCSRSGMVLPNVGPIGGKSQTGRYTIAARWNGPSLAERLRRIGLYGSKLKIITGDGIEHLEHLPGSGIEDEMFLFVDPPYIGVGNRLYAQGMQKSDHDRLAAALKALPFWVLTYDAHPDVLGLYPPEDHQVMEFEIPHSINQSHIGSEYLVAPLGVEIPLTHPLGKGAHSLVESA